MSNQAEAAAQSEAAPAPALRTRPIAASIVLLGGLAALALCMMVSIASGAADIRIPVVWEALRHFNPDLTPHQIIWELRLPRVLGAAIVGVCLSVAGAIMQGMTRNPLAEPGLLGLNAGAGLMLALCFAFFPGMPFILLIGCAFVGAGLAAGLVYGIGSLAKGGLTPVRLVLAGAALSALLAALGEGIALYYRIAQDLAFWYAGGVTGTTWLQLKIMSPLVGAAFLAALALSRSITMLSLGEEVARGLGQRTGLVKLAGTIVVLILAGAAVSVVGAVAFVGLIVPHAARFLVGVDYRFIIPCSAVLGGLLVVLADWASRMVHPPFETPIGALIALIGVPFFLYLARKEKRGL